VIHGLLNSDNSNDLEWPSRSLTYCKSAQIGFFVQLCSRWHSASRGPSATADLLYIMFSCAAATTRQESANITSTANVMRTTRLAAAHPTVKHVMVMAVTFWTAVATTTCDRTAASASTTCSAPVIRIGRRRTATTRATTSTDITQTTTATTSSSTAADMASTSSATAG